MSQIRRGFGGHPWRSAWDRPSHPMVVALTLACVASLGCRDDALTPTAPETAPALASATTQPLAFYQVTAGGDQSCGVTADNRLYCWGYNNHGQVGDGTQTDRLRPVPIASNLRFRQVSAGDLYTCAVTTDYQAYCWGQNYGALGDGTITERHLPVKVVGGHQFRQLSAGQGHTCAVALGDQAFCWGDNSYGALGDGSGKSQLTPVAVKGGLVFQQVDPGGRHTCGVTLSHHAYCWGSDEFGQVGDGSRVFGRVTPVAVATTRQFIQISAGGDATCAVTASDQAFCWGHGLDGQLGSGTQQLSTVPRPVVGGVSFTRVSVGLVHTCGESKANRAYCWGVNANGQVGSGTTTLRFLSPVPVAGGHTFAQVSAGSFHTCAKTGTGLGYCWGVNFNGTLGDGTTASSTVPVAVVGPS